MNYWIEESIRLANSAGYLDALQTVYPVTAAQRRPVSRALKLSLKEAFDGKDDLFLLREEEFSSQAQGISILDGSPNKLKQFSNEHLRASVEKRPDLVARHESRFVVGEAKFLTGFGGHQNTQLQDALELLRSRSGRVKRIAILDGVVWLKGENKMHRAVLSSGEDVLSALLLKDYLANL